MISGIAANRQVPAAGGLHELGSLENASNGGDGKGPKSVLKLASFFKFVGIRFIGSLRRSMGVTVSISMSIEKDGKLRGLVACHHGEANCGPAKAHPAKCCSCFSLHIAAVIGAEGCAFTAAEKLSCAELHPAAFKSNPWRHGSTSINVSTVFRGKASRPSNSGRAGSCCRSPLQLLRLSSALASSRLVAPARRKCWRPEGGAQTQRSLNRDPRTSGPAEPN
jgi:hypothetical protein